MTTTTTATAAGQLTGPEVAILRMLADGLTQDQIARRFNLTRPAITNRLWRIRGRLGAATTVQAVLIAHRTGLLDTRDGDR